MSNHKVIIAEKTSLQIITNNFYTILMNIDVPDGGCSIEGINESIYVLQIDDTQINTNLLKTPYTGSLCK